MDPVVPAGAAAGKDLDAPASSEVAVKAVRTGLGAAERSPNI
jgi:hypothetical protein